MTEAQEQTYRRLADHHRGYVSNNIQSLRGALRLVNAYEQILIDGGIPDLIDRFLRRFQDWVEAAQMSRPDFPYQEAIGKLKNSTDIIGSAGDHWIEEHFDNPDCMIYFFVRDRLICAFPWEYNYPEQPRSMELKPEQKAYNRMAVQVYRNQLTDRIEWLNHLETQKQEKTSDDKPVTA